MSQPARHRRADTGHRRADRTDGRQAGHGTKAKPADWEHFAPPPSRPTDRPADWAADRVGLARRLGTSGPWPRSRCARCSRCCSTWERSPTRRHTLPQDIWDPSLVAYLIAWDGHALLHHPASIWHLNAFYPGAVRPGLQRLAARLRAVRGSSAPGPRRRVLRYNVLFILAAGAGLLRRATRWPASSGSAGSGPRAGRRRARRWRRGGWPRPATCRSSPPAGSLLALAMLARGHGIRWRRTVSASAASGAEPRRERALDRPPRPPSRRRIGPAGPSPAGWSRPGSSPSASASGCPSSTSLLGCARRWR